MQSAVTVTSSNVLSVCRVTQRILMRKRNAAAIVILYLGTEGRVITQPLSIHGQEKIPQVVEGAYNHLMNLVDVDPAQLKCLLKRAELLLREAGKGEVHIISKSNYHIILLLLKESDRCDIAISYIRYVQQDLVLIFYNVE